MIKNIIPVTVANSIIAYLDNTLSMTKVAETPYPITVSGDNDNKVTFFGKYSHIM